MNKGGKTNYILACMSDIIKLLPDSVANQIAAGEVIQRPASAVKELLENSMDAGAGQIKLIIKDAGKTLIQVVDNGSGMSQTDARLCFERHATSKINRASDLFSIRTMGFRGEALASIAAIARVELKTRTKEDIVGTEVIVEGSVTESQQQCQCSSGTNIAVKNLFFNTPARRNFLKSEQIEKGHIYNEFIRIALSRPDIELMYYYNNQLTVKLDKGNLRQRIVGIYGNNYNQRLVPVEEKTDIISITGFVIKPEFARKKRGEQFIFINRRYIRSPYFNHAVEQAFQELIPEDTFPSFFLFLETEPEQIDVNVHPTKTEVKFQNEQYIYQILKTTVKRSLGKFNLTPTLDFERETAFDGLVIDKGKPPVAPSIHIDPGYNPFLIEKGSGGNQGKRGSLTGRINPEQWERLFHGHKTDKTGSAGKQISLDSRLEKDDREILSKKFIHIQNRFILAPVKSGLMIIDHQRAHERVLYERFLAYLDKEAGPSQQLLFPESIILMEQDAELFREMLPHIKATGFGISEAGKGTFIVTAVPFDMHDKGPLQDMIEEIIEQYQIHKADARINARHNLARSMARRLALRHGKTLAEQEMMALTESLFMCEMPYASPAGKPVVVVLTADEIAEKFK